MSFTPLELPAEKNPEEIAQETTSEPEEQAEIHEKDTELESASQPQQRTCKPIIYAILIVLISVFSIPFFMKPFHGKTKIAVKAGHGTSFSEDFESYNNGDFIDGKPRWKSSDDFQAKGWQVENAGAFKFIHFHPSPWPGGFKLGSNYATYHARFSRKISSLWLEFRYAVLPNSEMKVYVSGDDKSWVDVTEAIGMRQPLSENEWEKTKGNLFFCLNSANIEKDVYVKFTGAAYSGSGWGAHVAEIKVRAEIEEVAKGPRAEEQKIISYLGKHITEYIRERDPGSSWSIGPIQFYPSGKLLVYAETGHIALHVLFEYTLHEDAIMLRNLYQHARYRPDYLKHEYNLSPDDAVNYLPSQEGYKRTSRNVFESD
jgi:hypothetical protein